MQALTASTARSTASLCRYAAGSVTARAVAISRPAGSLGIAPAFLGARTSLEGKMMLVTRGLRTSPVRLVGRAMV